MNYKYIRETTSTNVLLRSLLREEKLPEMTVLRTDFQSAGKGQVGNAWESAPYKNLMFSILLYPTMIEIEKQFIISQIVSIAIVRVLSEYANKLTIKWPNDIYFKEKKIAGILIENSLQGAKINFSVIGIGLNVNQTEFYSDAPNPVSLCQITDKQFQRVPLMRKICTLINEMYVDLDEGVIRKEYLENLFRKDGFHFYRENNGNLFEASIQSINSDGQMILEKKDGELKGYYFKEVEFVL